MKIAIILSCAFVLTIGTPAHADDAEPWARAVPKEQQARADAVFAEANTLFERGSHTEALAKYREAIALWDHPRIRFNMAVTLLRLDQILEAADALDAALRYGSEPFTAERYAQALDYARLIRGRVGTIAAECSQSEVQVLLDGKRWFTCPGSERIRVLAGEHVLVAQRSGFNTLSRQVFLVGAATLRYTVDLTPMEQHVRYPTARWIPWATAGAGTVIAVSGLGSWFAGKNNEDRFEERNAIECSSRCSEGLADHPELRALRDRATLEGDLGIGLMITGGVIAIGGVAWATFVNRPMPVTLQVDTAGERGAVVRATWSLP